jgi:hypothetical protein
VSTGQIIRFHLEPDYANAACERIHADMGRPRCTNHSP